MISALRAAKADKVPAIVGRQRDLDARATAAQNVATDAIVWRRSCCRRVRRPYFFDSPNANKVKAIPAGSPVTIPSFGNGRSA